MSEILNNSIYGNILGYWNMDNKTIEFLDIDDYPYKNHHLISYICNSSISFFIL